MCRTGRFVDEERYGPHMPGDDVETSIELEQPRAWRSAPADDRAPGRDDVGRCALCPWQTKWHGQRDEDKQREPWPQRHTVTLAVRERGRCHKISRTRRGCRLRHALHERAV